MKENLRRSGTLYGIKFGQLDSMPNSHNALEAAEYTRSIGQFEEYHKALMDAYFRDVKDIGNINILVELGTKLGLNDKDLTNAIKERMFENKLSEDVTKAHQFSINSTPTFIINNKHKIIGAQPIEVFRKLFDDIEKNKK